jgi:LysM repeat protein
VVSVERQQTSTDQRISQTKQVAKKTFNSSSSLDTQKRNTPKPQIGNPQQAVVKPAQVATTEQLRLANIIPTIQPINTDLTGALRLKGSAAPNSHILLLLNGHKVSSVEVTPAGQWSYETHLKPGEYSVQVMDDRNLKQSKSYQVVISKPHVQSQPPRPQPVPAAPKIQIKWSDQTRKSQTTQSASTVVLSNKPIRSRLGTRLYRVKPGDTLHAISKQYAVTVDEITHANNISDKHQIEVGQMLEIPIR